MTEQDLNEDTPIENIGALLAEAREEKGLSLASAAMQTKLSVDIIEKLESNRFKEIGAPVFSRGYLGIYARFLGLNQAAFTRAFNQLSMDSTTELRLTSANVAGQKKSYKRSPWKAWLALIPLFALAGVVVVQVADNESWLMQQIRGAFANTPSEAEGDQALPNQENDGAEDIVLQIGPDPEVTPSENVADTTTTQPEMTDGNELQLVAETTNSTELDSTSADSSAEAAAESSAAEETPKAAELQVLGETWLEVKNGNGRVVASAILKKGDSVALPLLEAPFSMNIGRPGDVALMLGDQNIDLTPFRQRGSERRFTVSFADEGSVQ